jgi:folate-binding protein YgfZ
MLSIDAYHALRRQCALVRRGDRGVLAVSGTDRLGWLQGLLTNDVVNLPAGGVCEAAYLTPQGRMITDARVFNLAERVLLDVPAPLAEALQAKLDSLLFSEDASVQNVSSSLALVELHGPAAPAVADRLRAEPWAERATVVRHDVFELPAYAVFVAVQEVDAVTASAIASGAVVATLETLDVIRVEAGRPAFLVDMDEHTIPLEAGLEQRAISFTKGCYVGQEVIVRVVHRGGGRVAKRLVGLTMSTSDVPAAGSSIHAGGRELGRVTSAVWSPALSCAIALGYLHRDHVEPGTRVEVATAAGPLGAAVTALPFLGQTASSSTTSSVS